MLMRRQSRQDSYVITRILLISAINSIGLWQGGKYYRDWRRMHVLKASSCKGIISTIAECHR